MSLGSVESIRINFLTVWTLLPCEGHINVYCVAFMWFECNLVMRFRICALLKRLFLCQDAAISNQDDGEEWDNQEVENLDPQAYLQNLTDDLEQAPLNDDVDDLDNEEYHHTVQQV